MNQCSNRGEQHIRFWPDHQIGDRVRCRMCGATIILGDTGKPHYLKIPVHQTPPPPGKAED